MGGQPGASGDDAPDRIAVVTVMLPAIPCVLNDHAIKLVLLGMPFDSRRTY